MKATALDHLKDDESSGNSGRSQVWLGWSEEHQAAIRINFYHSREVGGLGGAGYVLSTIA